MKKLLSLFAAAIVCAVMFTSCGSEFQDDLFDAFIQNDWEESFFKNPLLSNNIKYSYFVQEFCLNIILLNDLFVEELKNFD